MLLHYKIQYLLPSLTLAFIIRYYNTQKLTCNNSNLTSAASTLVANLRTKSIMAEVSICLRIQSTGLSFDLRNSSTLK